MKELNVYAQYRQTSFIDAYKGNQACNRLQNKITGEKPKGGAARGARFGNLKNVVCFFYVWTCFWDMAINFSKPLYCFKTNVFGFWVYWSNSSKIRAPSNSCTFHLWILYSFLKGVVWARKGIRNTACQIQANHLLLRTWKSKIFAGTQVLTFKLFYIAQRMYLIFSWHITMKLWDKVFTMDKKMWKNNDGVFATQFQSFCYQFKLLVEWLGCL